MVLVQVTIPLYARALCAYPLLNNIFRPPETNNALGLIELATAASACARDSTMQIKTSNYSFGEVCTNSISRACRRR